MEKAENTLTNYKPDETPENEWTNVLLREEKFKERVHKVRIQPKDKNLKTILPSVRLRTLPIDLAPLALCVPTVEAMGGVLAGSRRQRESTKECASRDQDSKCQTDSTDGASDGSSDGLLAQIAQMMPQIAQIVQ